MSLDIGEELGEQLLGPLELVAERPAESQIVEEGVA
jgi:hypothetical protein